MAGTVLTMQDATAFVDRLMALWRQPVPAGDAGIAAFRTCYAEQLTVNGTPFTLAELVARARSLQAAYSGIRPEVLDVVAAPGRVVVAFVMHVRHTGPLPTPLGVLPPTGRTAAIRTIDVLAVDDGLVTAVTVVADELGLLTQLGGVHLIGSSSSTPAENL
jgi:hypothetical protein